MRPFPLLLGDLLETEYRGADEAGLLAASAFLIYAVKKRRKDKE